MSGTLFSKLANAPARDFSTNRSEAGSATASLTSEASLLPRAVPEVISKSPDAAILFSLIERCQNKTDLIKTIAEVSRRSVEQSFLWYIESDPKAGERALALTSADQTALWQTINEDVARLLACVDQPGKVIQTGIVTNESSTLLGTCLQNENGKRESIVAICPAAPDQVELTENFISQFALTVQSWMQQSHLRSTLQSSAVYQKLVQLSNILTGVDSLDEAHVCTVNFLREMVQARQVGLAVRRKGQSRFRVEAISDIESFDRTGELCSSMMTLAQICTDGKKSVHWGPEVDEIDAENIQEEREADAQIRTQWQKRFCNLNSCDFASAVPVPLRNGDEACLLIAHGSEESANVNRSLIEAFGKTMSNQLGLLQQSSRGAFKISTDHLLAKLKSKTGKTILGVVGALVALMLIPMPYTVKSDCQLEPVQRRFVAAPFDGVVDRCLVESGDVVKANQVLAELDGRQLRIELSGLQASLKSEQKKHDSALANRDVAQSQIALLEVKKLKADIALINQKLNHLVIRSPIDGIVVSGDLEKAEGAPIEIGQNLFEIAPLDRMLVEVEVAESEVSYAKPGQKAIVLFDAFPYDKFEGKIVKIHPRSEIRQDQSIFIAEVELENENGQLRPGMKGRCRIRSDWYPLGWNLFHHSFENVRGWLVW